MRVNVLALGDVFDLGLSAVLDVFQTANELLAVSKIPIDRFDVKTVAVRRRVRTSHGLTVPIDPIDRRTPDCVVIPAIGYKMPEPLERALSRPDMRDASELLHDYARRNVTVTAACIGTFILAESGLLNGHRATTTWWLAPMFRSRYPDVELEDSSMLVHSGRFVTAGAALGHMDLALWLVRSVSPQLASLTAQYLIVDSRPSQSAYALTDHLVHTDPLVGKFESWARANLARGFSLNAAARAVGSSKRTLARRLDAVLGKSPLEYVQALRVERAVHLLKTTRASVDEIAARVGYSDGVTLRALLRRSRNTGVREIRASS
jgi:transcriptional regulator GlxA family with amidase domain